MAKMGYPDVLFEDSKAEPRTAVTAAQRLISINGVDAVLGGMFSNTTLAIAPLAQANEVVLVTPTASLETIVGIGDHIFSIYPTDRYEGRLGAQTLLDAGYKRIGLFRQQMQVFDTMSQSFRETVLNGGASLSFDQVFPSKTRDFRLLIQKIGRVDCDVVYIAAYREEACNLIQQLREWNPNIRIHSQSTLFDPATLVQLGSRGENVIFSAPPFNDKTSSDQIEQFRQKYKDKYATLPSVWAAYGYDSMILMINALKMASNGEVSLNQVMTQSSLDGVTGRMFFNPDRTVNRTMALFEIKNGRFVRFEGY